MPPFKAQLVGSGARVAIPSFCCARKRQKDSGLTEMQPGFYGDLNQLLSSVSCFGD